MQVYGDLTFRGSPGSLAEFILAVERRLPSDWVRGHDQEAGIRQAALGKMYCFACKAEKTRPASELWIATHSNGNLYVSNILPQALPSLSYDQYNRILVDFCDSCARPVADTCGVEIELGNPDPKIDDFLSPDTTRLLRSFSAQANRSNLHPFDRKRWNEFVTSAYREGATLGASMLQRWLIEEEKWPEDEAILLAIDYEHARDLLRVFEAQPA